MSRSPQYNDIKFFYNGLQIADNILLIFYHIETDSVFM